MDYTEIMIKLIKKKQPVGLGHTGILTDYAQTSPRTLGQNYIN